MTPDPITVPEDVAQELAVVMSRLGPLASQIAWYASVSSTNDVAAALAEAGADEGCLVVADAQTAGRGRQGREWASPAGAGIYASVILRPDARVVPLLTIAAGVAVAEGIQVATGLETRVKWPNDVYIDTGRSDLAGGRKVAGILAEAGFAGNGPSHVVLGFGINVLPAAYPPEIASRATSIERELGRAVSRGLLLAECLAALWGRYVALRQGLSSPVLAEWRRRAIGTFGRRVEWQSGEDTRCGIAEDVDHAGALLVRTDVGVARVTSGEVRWLP
jgi:BirA family transcriptional regulator, biotin operon repressor / biotin---[acetyl-CoA-carboxylase] ligase